MSDPFISIEKIAKIANFVQNFNRLSLEDQGRIMRKVAHMTRVHRSGSPVRFVFPSITQYHARPATWQAVAKRRSSSERDNTHNGTAHTQDSLR